MDLRKNIQIVIDSLKEGNKEDFYNNGICGEISDLEDRGVFDKDTQKLLIDFITMNEPNPTLHSEFQCSELYPDHKNWGWWWPLMEECPEARQTRIDFLIKLRDSIPE